MRFFERLFGAGQPEGKAPESEEERLAGEMADELEGEGFGGGEVLGTEGIPDEDSADRARQRAEDERE